MLAENNDHEAKKARRELTDALVPSYDNYMQMLLECHSKHLKRFNLTPYEYAALDVAKQQNIAS